MHFITLENLPDSKLYVQYPLYFVSVTMFGMYGQMEEEDDYKCIRYKMMTTEHSKGKQNGLTKKAIYTFP